MSAYSLADLNRVFARTEDLVSACIGFIQEGRSGYLVTCNLDHWMRLDKDDEFRGVYEASDIQTLDGRPLEWVTRFIWRHRIARVTGADLPWMLLARCPAMRVGIVGGEAGASTRAASRLRAEGFVNATGFEIGYVSDSAEAGQTLVGWSKARDLQLLLVCLGSPKQEYVAEVIAAQGGPFCLCVGGFVDFASGSRRRAPRSVQALGLEWLFRALQDPRRLLVRYVKNGLYLPRFVISEIQARRGEREFLPL